MYSPRIEEDQIRRLHRLAKRRNKHMTEIVEEAIDRYLDEEDDPQDESSASVS